MTYVIRGYSPDVDLVPTAQSTLTGRDFAQGCLFFKTGEDHLHPYWHKAAAVQTSSLAADDIVGMKVVECYGPEEITLKGNGACDQLVQLLARSTSQLQAGSPD
jgi:hypothetical protein